MRPSPELLAYLRGWEGPPSLVVREDPAAPGIYDIGYGCVVRRDHPPITIEEAEAMLAAKAIEFGNVVGFWVTGRPSRGHVTNGPGTDLEQHQFDGLTSLVYNIGVGRAADGDDPGRDGFVWLRSGKHSTILSLLNAGDFESAAKEFPKWNRSGGQVRRGLVKRREGDLAIFRDGDYSRRP